MSRVTSGVTTHRRHKKITDQAKGYYGRRKNTFKVATQAVDKANQYATRTFLQKKRQNVHTDGQAGGAPVCPGLLLFFLFPLVCASAGEGQFAFADLQLARVSPAGKPRN